MRFFRINPFSFAAHQSQLHDKPVIYISGNHEFYHHDYDVLLSEIRVISERHENVHFLECDELMLDGVRFLGTTFWTDYWGNGTTNKMRNMAELQQFFPDHRLIKKDNKAFKTSDAFMIHLQSKAWLNAKLDESFDGKTVVVTHHGPSLCCQHPFFDDNEIAAGFLSNCDALVAKADVWIYGHTHPNIDIKIGNCRLVSNQVGYPNEKLPIPFRAEWLFEI
tara:strand:+ start:37180 stop:37842 length:663 start_codon:yes stop_codon:yes gene_type:complete